jgi:hypothetical protein
MNAIMADFLDNFYVLEIFISTHCKSCMPVEIEIFVVEFSLFLIQYRVKIKAKNI